MAREKLVVNAKNVFAEISAVEECQKALKKRIRVSCIRGNNKVDDVIR